MDKINIRSGILHDDLNDIDAPTWINVQELREWIISDQENKFRDCCLNDHGMIKSTISKLLEQLK